MRSNEQEQCASRRLANYSVMTLVASGALTVATPAQADIQVFSSGLTTTPAPTFALSENNDVFFDFATGTSQKTSFAGADFRLNNNTGGAGFSNLVNLDPSHFWLANADDCPARLAAGALIGPGGDFSNDFTTLAGPMGDWNGLGRDYVGLQFDVGGNTHYGWADIEVFADRNITLHRFGYEDTPDTAIQAGAVGAAAAPEPTPLALLVLGAAGIGAYRRMNS